MSLQTAPGREVRRMLQAQGQHAWVALTQRYGKTFRFSGMVITCEPEAVRALLMDRAHAEKRPAAHRFLGWLPGVNGILFMDGEPWLKRTRAVMRFPAQHRRLSRLARGDGIARGAVGNRARRGCDAVQQLSAASILRMGYGLVRRIRWRWSSGARWWTTNSHHDAGLGYRFDDFGVAPSKLPAATAAADAVADATRPRASGARSVCRSRPDVLNGPTDPPTRRRRSGGRELAGGSIISMAPSGVDYAVAATSVRLASDHRLAAVIRAEIASVIGDRESPAREDLPQLLWTNAFMLEIFRRYPVTMAAVRMTGKPMVLGGETLASGTQVGILLHALHHHPDFWDSPNELKPGRWIESPAPKVPYSYVPFLDGSRKCIGRAMAEMVWLVVVSTIVRRFDLRVFGEAIVPPFMVPRFARPIPHLERTAAGA